MDLLELLRKQAAGGDLDFLREAAGPPQTDNRKPTCGRQTSGGL
ncbi:MAG: hypothetical protein OXG35_11625 [Acidobacteria bacterium]|nr:hypothetical protein [Acidobacteriota bacterium]